MIRNPRLSVCVGLALAFASAGCRPTAAPPAAPPESARSYRLTGVVRGVNLDEKRVTIRHDEIPGFMAAMTMPFTLDDPTTLAALSEGDEVAGTLRVEFSPEATARSYRLEGLTVTHPALRTLKLDLSTGNLKEAEPPKALEPGRTIPDFSYTTAEGLPASLADDRGQYVVLTFIYTRCPLPDFCPLMDRKFAELADRLRLSPGVAARVRLISMSFDPENDTPEVLARHARNQGAIAPLWTFGVASHEELARVGPKLGLTYGPTQNEIIHNLITVVIGPEGALLRREPGRNWQPAELARFLRSEVEASQDRP